jgi:hypothetical protein
MMDFTDPLRDTTKRLEDAGIEYYLVGSLAAMQYGRPRFTNDIDLVVQIKVSELATFVNVFDIEEYYCPPKEVIADEVIRGGMFNLIHQASQMKLILFLSRKRSLRRLSFLDAGKLKSCQALRSISRQQRTLFSRSSIITAKADQKNTLLIFEEYLPRLKLIKPIYSLGLPSWVSPLNGRRSNERIAVRLLVRV